MIDLILVPQGMEYKAVCQGLIYIHSYKPLVMAIPIGYESVTKYLKSQNFEQWQGKNCLIMGLGGSLSSQHSVGDVVLCQDCLYQNKTLSFDTELTLSLQQALNQQISLVKCLTSDHIIDSTDKKAQLYQEYQTDIVDMEGFAILEFSQSLGIKVAMLRVISDDSSHDIPNLNNAININGSLNSLQLTMSLIQQPLKALTLIKGSFKGLQALKNITYSLFI